MWDSNKVNNSSSTTGEQFEHYLYGSYSSTYARLKSLKGNKEKLLNVLKMDNQYALKILKMNNQSFNGTKYDYWLSNELGQKQFNKLENIVKNKGALHIFQELESNGLEDENL